MPDTPTTHYSIMKPPVGGDNNTWGTVLNTSLDTIDTSIWNVSVVANAALPSASYTAADVLTKIKTVDGTGSGLDADLLDGQHASAFALASSITASSLLTSIKTVDGTGSGLDADLLDGQHASAFSLTTHNHDATYLALAGGAVTGNITRASAGPHTYHNDPAMTSGRIFITAVGAADPTSQPGDIWLEVS